MDEDTYKAALAAQLRGVMAARELENRPLAKLAGCSEKTVSDCRRGRGTDDAYRKLAKACGSSWAVWVAHAEEASK